MVIVFCPFVWMASRPGFVGGIGCNACLAIVCGLVLSGRLLQRSLRLLQLLLFLYQCIEAQAFCFLRENTTMDGYHILEGTLVEFVSLNAIMLCKY